MPQQEETVAAETRSELNTHAAIALGIAVGLANLLLFAGFIHDAAASFGQDIYLTLSIAGISLATGLVGFAAGIVAARKRRA